MNLISKHLQSKRLGKLKDFRFGSFLGGLDDCSPYERGGDTVVE